MRAALNGLAALLHVALLLGLSYFVGTLLGLAAGNVLGGKLLGVVIGVLALIMYYREPEPTEAQRRIDNWLSRLRGDLVVRTGYGDAGAFVFAMFLVVIAAATTGAFVAWLAS